MMNQTDLKALLAGFTGTQDYHRVSPLHGPLVLTDGALALAEAGECFWLFDVIASHQPRCLRDSMLSEVQFWTLDVMGDGSAVARCERDAGDEFLRQAIEFTDFPMNSVRIIVGRQPIDEHGGFLMVAMLPSER
jgi:hypothetical protein